MKKEKHKIHLFNDVRRSAAIAAALLFVLFNAHRTILFSEVNQVYSPDLSTEEFQKPTDSTHQYAVPRSSTTDRDEVRKMIYSLPTNPKDYSTIETMVSSHSRKDESWYNVCEKDNAAEWTRRQREHGGDIGKYFHRACPDERRHPGGVHLNPFQMRTYNCSATSRINLEIQRGDFGEDWRIQTMDAKGVPKTIGGDNLYVVYSEYIDGKENPNPNAESQLPSPVAVAIPIDYRNGTYGLDFVSVPFQDSNAMSSNNHENQQKNGTLSIHAITTCFIGQFYPPHKDGWKTGGHTNVTWTIENVSRPYKIKDWYADRYHPKQYQESIDPKKKVQNSLSEFDRIVIAGDSIMTQMVWDLRRRDYFSTISEMVKGGRIWKSPTQDDGTPVRLHIPLSNSTLETYLAALEPWIRGLDDDRKETNTAEERTLTKPAKKKALVLGSAAWDIIWPAEWQGLNFDNHLSSVEALLRHFRTNYPDVTLVWKLPYAHHVQEANPEVCFTAPELSRDKGACVRILRYATKERFENLYHLQKRFIEEKFQGDDKVRLLDFYEVSYLSGSHLMIPGDSIHYHPEFNERILEMLFQ